MKKEDMRYTSVGAGPVSAQKRENIKIAIPVGACIARPQNKNENIKNVTVGAGHVSAQEKGITLIALVITIIVLLILAGVALNLTIGERGIFRTAQQGAKNYIDSAKQEENMLAELTNTTDKIIANVTGGIGGTTPTIDINTLKAGDYIKYDSGKNGVITCRVLYPANSEYGLQIISDKSVKKVTLGSTNKDYAEAVESYNNVIETLNNEAENYINTEYAYDGRCVGSAPTVEKGMFVNKNKVKFEGTEEYVTPTDANYYKLPFENTNYIKSYASDINYKVDKEQMETAGILFIADSDNYWLASRNIDFYNSACYGGVRIIIPGKGLGTRDGTRVEPSGVVAGSGYTHGFRPCISLKTDIIKITSGDGKSVDTAYVIGK